MNSLILGFGNAGEALHLPVLRKLLAASPALNLNPLFHVFDNQAARMGRHTDDVQFHSLIPTAEVDLLGPTVCHVCTPPGNRVELIGTLLERGHRYILVEKPVASDAISLDQLIGLEKKYSAHVLVVSVFSNSRLVEKIRSLIEPEPDTQAWRLMSVQKKSRYDRSAARANEHIFEIEIPHQVALAVDLFGPATVKNASTSHMVTPDGRVIPDMGTGRIQLSHHNGAISVLDSSLVHPSRERAIRVHTGRGSLFTGHFPAGRDDNVSTLVMGGKTQIILDEPLTQCISLAYRYFNKIDQERTVASHPALSSMTLPFHRQVMQILDAAKRAAVSTPVYQDNSASLEPDNVSAGLNGRRLL
ncbi:Gfo/Idh/MocA family oxidoreductase [Rhizobium ruizarguesonis]|uniref:Gfo/Idh/MocA family oxidoreductase n=1 Tax=Rhizobium ruizarguesonis TaxID=2081791 RepID=UPI001030C93E|nr:Gfo/Idh/MocA family oxidoreductase [Rhizobium ruizarguesonis]TBA11995.1 hypothetical protein ELH65_26640 [Rhizobium ruizarguesonis]